MNWQEIRALLPNRWVIVEAVNAYSEGKYRVIPEMKVVKVFENDWKTAWDSYKELHSADRWREYYMLHTDREELNIGLMDPFGRIVDAEGKAINE